MESNYKRCAKQKQNVEKEQQQERMFEHSKNVNDEIRRCQEKGIPCSYGICDECYLRK